MNNLRTSEDDKPWIFLREFTREILTNISISSFRDDVRSGIRHKLSDLIRNKDVVLREGESSSITSIHHPKFSPIISESVSESPGIDFGKISSLLSDSEVFVIECPGPGKYLNIKKPSSSDTSSISLTEDDIKKIIGEFARVVNSYPTEGVFNAQFKNYSLTAVMSELAGSRFVLTRYLDVKKLISDSSH